jgi:hypothetical protein
LQVGFTDFFIYVDVASGSDSNPGTQTEPVKTYAAAIALLPAVWKSNAQIIFAPGTYPIDRDTVAGPIGFSGPSGGSGFSLMFRAASMAAQTITGESGATFTSAAGLITNRDTVTTTNNDTATLNQYRGPFFIKCISSSTPGMTGQMRMIVGNNVAAGAPVTFTLNSPLPATVAATDTWQVQTHAVIFNISGIYLAAGVGNKRVGYMGIKKVFTSTSNGTSLGFEDYSNIAYCACSWDLTNCSSTAVGSNHGVGIFADGADGGGNWGRNNPQSPFVVAGSITGSNSTQAGLYINGAAKSWSIGGTFVQGYLVIDGIFSFLKAGVEACALTLSNPNVKSTRFVLGGVTFPGSQPGNNFLVAGNDNSGGAGGTTTKGKFDTTTSGISCVTIDARGNFSANGLDISNCAAGVGAVSAIVADHGSFVRLYDVSGSNNGAAGVTATTSGAGVELRHMSEVVFLPAARTINGLSVAATTVTGHNTGGGSIDVRFGAPTAVFAGPVQKAWQADLNAGTGGFTDPFQNRGEPDTCP